MSDSKYYDFQVDRFITKSWRKFNSFEVFHTAERRLKLVKFGTGEVNYELKPSGEGSRLFELYQNGVKSEQRLWEL